MIQAARAQVAELTQAAYERAAAAGVLTGGAEVKATVEIPKDTAHGDYASSFAMAGAKALHMAPRAIAQAIVDHAVADCLERHVSDWGKIKNIIRDSLSDFLWKRMKRNPMILPIIMEV